MNLGKNQQGSIGTFEFSFQVFQRYCLYCLKLAIVKTAHWLAVCQWGSIGFVLLTVWQTPCSCCPRRQYLINSWVTPRVLWTSRMTSSVLCGSLATSSLLRVIPVSSSLLWTGLVTLSLLWVSLVTSSNGWWRHLYLKNSLMRLSLKKYSNGSNLKGCSIFMDVFIKYNGLWQYGKKQTSSCSSVTFADFKLSGHYRWIKQQSLVCSLRQQLSSQNWYKKVCSIKFVLLDAPYRKKTIKIFVTWTS
jgi:hypothetical protein